MTDITAKIARLVAMGGREWKNANGAEHRVYFDAKTANALAGIERLASGGYRFGTEKISTYRFNEVSLKDFHFDVVENAFQVSGRWNKETFAAAVAEIQRRLQEPVVEPATPAAGSYEEFQAKLAMLNEESKDVLSELAQMQRDAEALTGEDDPRYAEMNARFEALEGRKFELANEGVALTREYGDVIRAHKKARFA